jgi:hypothetical protein
VLSILPCFRAARQSRSVPLRRVPPPFFREALGLGEARLDEGETERSPHVCRGSEALGLPVEFPGFGGAGDGIIKGPAVDEDMGEAVEDKGKGIAVVGVAAGLFHLPESGQGGGKERPRSLCMLMDTSMGITMPKGSPASS